MNRKILFTASLLGIIAIVLGAFGAHSLKEVLTTEQLNTFETGVKYQMYHALFLLFLGNSNSITEKMKKYVLNLILFGVILFSGSIYLLATMALTGINFKIIGILTPIGGLLLLLGWGIFGMQVLQKKS